MKKVPFAFSLCEEFSNTVLIDDTRHSIILNVAVMYFSHIYRELKRYNYILVFKTKIESTNSITCAFIQKDKYIQ